MGGDGTVHEVVNGLMQLPPERRPVLGVVPIGSGNDFCFSMGVPREADRALFHALQAENVHAIDIGRMTDEHGRQEYFDNTVGIGFDAVVTIRSHKLPIVKGFLMYLTAVIQTILLNHDPARVTVETDQGTWQDQVIMTTLCNGPREGGGFMIAPAARNDDGLLDFTVVRRVSRAMMFRLVPEFMKGTHIDFKEHIRIGTCRRFRMTSDLPLYIHADGEIFTSFGSNTKSVEFEILPEALKVVKG
jgi:YegS/Rv2252/BmrU family lipid kinase